MNSGLKTVIWGAVAGVLVVVLGGIAILTALKQSPEAPVAPTVPQIRPQAVEPRCVLNFTVAAAASPTPTLTPTPTPRPTYQHKVCLGSACTMVDCSPPTTICVDLCASDSNCAVASPTPTPTVAPQQPSATHYECRNRACVVVVGTGPDTCASDAFCQPPPLPPPIPPAGNALTTLVMAGLGIGVLALGLALIF